MTSLILAIADLAVAPGRPRPPIDPYAVFLSVRLFSAALTAGLLTWIGWLMRRDWKQQEWERTGRCRHCGYDLRESPGRCPECGWRSNTGEQPQPPEHNGATPETAGRGDQPSDEPWREQLWGDRPWHASDDDDWWRGDQGASSVSRQEDPDGRRPGEDAGREQPWGEEGPEEPPPGSTQSPRRRPGSRRWGHGRWRRDS